MKSFVLLATLIFGSIGHGWAQQTRLAKWAIRAGYLRSIPVLAQNEVSLPVPISQIGIRPIDGYYVGGLYTLAWKRIGFRTELNYQRKGMTGYDINMTPVERINYYHYLGLTPTIGGLIVPHLSLYVGPEVNLLLTKNSLFVHSNSLEISASARLSYQVNSFELVVGGSRGLNAYAYTVSGGQTVLSYRNQSWQLGLVYILRSL